MMDSSMQWITASWVIVVLGATSIGGLWWVKRALQRSVNRLGDRLKAQHEAGLKTLNDEMVLRSSLSEERINAQVQSVQTEAMHNLHKVLSVHDAGLKTLSDEMELRSSLNERRINAQLQTLQTEALHKLLAMRDQVGTLQSQVHELGQQTQQLALNATQWSQKVAELEGKTVSNIQDLGKDLKASLDQKPKASSGAVVTMGVQALMSAGSDQGSRLDRLQNDITFIKTRTNSYLGRGVGLTWLVDETPIYINTDDMGCPSNFMNGGRYEEEYYQVLASFRKPDSVFLDIGANLGVFSLRLAPMMREGKVFAFEPNPKIYELLARSVHLNGVGKWVHPVQMGASDRDSELALFVPEGHAGGASLVPADAGTSGPTVPVRRLDDALQDLSHFDIAKLDVEGHELAALRGMSRLLSQSDQAVILFEKLSAHSGIEKPLLDIFYEARMQVYRIDGHSLEQVDEAAFCESSAYFLATRPERIGKETRRDFIDIYPQDTFAVHASVKDGKLQSKGAVPTQSILFHGPYWHLAKGSYRLSVVGEVTGSLKLSVTEKYGFVVASSEVSDRNLEFEFVASNDLSQFEVVATCKNRSTSFSIERLRLTRVG